VDYGLGVLGHQPLVFQCTWITLKEKIVGVDYAIRWIIMQDFLSQIMKNAKSIKVKGPTT